MSAGHSVCPESSDHRSIQLKHSTTYRLYLYCTVLSVSGSRIPTVHTGCW